MPLWWADSIECWSYLATNVVAAGCTLPRDGRHGTANSLLGASLSGLGTGESGLTNTIEEECATEDYVRDRLIVLRTGMLYKEDRTSNT